MFSLKYLNRVLSDCVGGPIPATNTIVHEGILAGGHRLFYMIKQCEIPSAADQLVRDWRVTIVIK